MSKEQIIGLLQRVLQMEEEMSSRLVDLCRPDSLPGGLPDDVRKRLRGGLVSIQKDTQRHMRAASAILLTLQGQADE